MLNIAICDDLMRDRIKLQDDIGAYFKDKDTKYRVETFASGDEFLAHLADQLFHIVFMDVYMEGISGIEASKRIRKMGNECAIIFTTTSPDHAIAGYEVRASDYLLKPFEREDVFIALDYAIEHLPKTQLSIEVISDRKRVSVPIGDIAFIEVYGHECLIHLASGEIVSTNLSLRSLQEAVGSEFIRCHKSYIVNAALISRPVDGSFLMQSGDKVPIGAESGKNCLQEYFEWSFHHTWGK